MADENTASRDGDAAWKLLLADLQTRRATAVAMGGEERLMRRREAGRLDARVRVDLLCDAGSFRELGALAGAGGLMPAPADAFVAGSARIDGRPVLVGAEDFTVQGGSIGHGTHAKRVRLARMAARERVPLVMLLEGAGERVSNAFERYPHAPNDLQALVDLSGRVPTVAVVLGPSAGHGALTAPLMDVVVMAEGASLFAAGPPLVEAATGEKVDANALGGPDVHVRTSGVAHAAVGSEAEALAWVRRYLGYLPSNAWQYPPRHDAPEGARSLDEMLDVLPANPRTPYDARDVIALVVDRESAFELQREFGGALLTCLARLGGHPVAVVASQPRVRAGALDRDAADKGARFLELAGAFHLPVLFLADTPGVLAGSAAERSGALRAAARMFAAQSRLRSPKLHVTLRKAYGFGSSLMAMNPFDRQTTVLALPGATLGAMPAQGGGDAAGVDDTTRTELAAREAGGPYSAADTLGYDDVIDPRDLRNALLDALLLSTSRRAASPRPRRQRGVRP